MTNDELNSRRAEARDMEGLTLDVIRAFRGIEVGDYWRKFWSPTAIVTSAGRTGSMNHATIGAMVGLIVAIRKGDVKTIEELLDWWEAYFDYMRANLGGKESPHSRIYLVWVLVPILHLQVYLSKSGKRPQLYLAASEWMEATVAYMSLVAIDEPARAGKFLDWSRRETWKGYACAATGGRSWSTVNSNTDIAVHLDLWRAEPILYYLINGGKSAWPSWNYYWGRDAIKEMESSSVYSDPGYSISLVLRKALKEVVQGQVHHLNTVIDAADRFLPFSEFSYLRFEKGVACVMHTGKGMSNSTAPMYAARHKKGDGEMDILVVDNGGRDIGSKDYDVIMGTATISDDAKTVTAVRGPGPLERGSVARASLSLSDLGPLVYWIKSNKKGVTVHKTGPGWPKGVPLPDGEKTEDPPSEPPGEEPENPFEGTPEEADNLHGAAKTCRRIIAGVLPGAGSIDTVDLNIAFKALNRVRVRNS